MQALKKYCVEPRLELQAADEGKMAVEILREGCKAKCKADFAVTASSTHAFIAWLNTVIPMVSLMDRFNEPEISARDAAELGLTTSGHVARLVCIRQCHMIHEA